MNRKLSWGLLILADGLSLLLILWLVEPLSGLLAKPAGLNSLLLISLYLLFLASVYVLRKLEPEEGILFPVILGQKTRGGLALAFGLVMMTAVSYQLGYFDVFMQAGPEELNEGASSSFFVFGPGAWLFLSMFYIFVLAFPISPRIATGSRFYLPATFLALLGGNGLLVLAIGQLSALMNKFGLGGAAWLLPLTLLLALLFLPPRLLYAQKQGGWFTILSQSILLLASVWLILT